MLNKYLLNEWVNVECVERWIMNRWMGGWLAGWIDGQWIDK